jgi:hypothetical protein
MPNAFRLDRGELAYTAADDGEIRAAMVAAQAVDL